MKKGLNRLGMIICKDNRGATQERWLKSFLTIFDHLKIKPHLITSPKEVRRGCGYVWRPNHENFYGEYKDTEQLSKELYSLAREFEKRGAVLLPAAKDLGFYENKRKLLELAESKGINIPVTVFCKTKEEAIKSVSTLPIPLLIKHPYSCNSFGLVRIRRRQEAGKLIGKYFEEFDSCILQEDIKINRDLRINFVGDQGLCCYWRTKESGSISSATRFGGRVDHFSIPIEGFDFAREVAKKLKLASGGIDMAWRGDDLKTKPVLLEVSPIFDINPVPLKPTENWQKFKKSREWGGLYHQLMLEFAARQIDYLRSKIR